MPQVPVPIRFIIFLALMFDSGALGDDPQVCWSDGRTDILVLADECPPHLPSLDEFPLWLSWYDPALCYDAAGNIIENINCDVNPANMAGGTAVTSEMYGYAGACLPQWFDRHLMITGVGERQCLDTGGAIVPTYREIYHPQRGFITIWLIPFDALEHHARPPWWEYNLVEPSDWYLGE
ncbi:MAG: hypothetical protein KC419_17105 [Anaerolineales bacterium]|nr:hypothetical protein [Anaerolineales bacterium]